MLNATNIWNSLVDWFHDRSERSAIIRDFNNSAKTAFITGGVPVLLKAKISKGDPEFVHNFSWRGSSGFRIEAMGGRELGKSEIIAIGEVVLNNDTLVRKLVAHGWDTLEVHGDVGVYGCKWRLREFLSLGM